MIGMLFWWNSLPQNIFVGTGGDSAYVMRVMLMKSGGKSENIDVNLKNCVQVSRSEPSIRGLCHKSNFNIYIQIRWLM